MHGEVLDLLGSSHSRARMRGGVVPRNIFDQRGHHSPGVPDTDITPA